MQQIEQQIVPGKSTKMMNMNELEFKSSEGPNEYLDQFKTGAPG